MPRDHARINLAIWNDPDWRRLPPLAQHLYLTLWTHPDLSYAGVVDWRPGRIAALAGGWTASDVSAAADCLEARLFVVRDEDTEECLIRSWVRWDGLLKQPIMAVSFANAYAATASNTIRGVIVHEAKKTYERQPEMAGWSKGQVRAILDNPSLDPATRTLPRDPFTLDLTPALTPAVRVRAGVGVNPCPNTPSTPTPTPTTEAPAPKHSGRKRPARALPDDWQPKDYHIAKAKELGVDINRAVETFRNHAGANDRRQVDWDKGFTNWLLKEKPSNVTPLPTARRTPDQIIDGWMFR